VRSGVQSTKAAVTSGKGFGPPLFYAFVGTYVS
jgi:hypothetical protein